MSGTFDIASELAKTNEELETMKETVRDVANEIANISDVIEPVLLSHSKRLRAARMATVDELRQIGAAVRDVRSSLMSEETTMAIERAERIMRLMKEANGLAQSGALILSVTARG